MQETQASTEMITLPPAARAAIALGSGVTELALKELVEKSARIVDVIDADGRSEAHRAGMDLRNVRTAIAKLGKTSREDATAFSKAVIEEERRLTGLITPEEDRVIALRDKFDANVAAEKAERERKEAERKAALQSKVDAIRNIPLGLAGEPSSAIAAEIDALRGFEPEEAEFYDYAEKAREAAAFAVLALLDLHDKVATKEAADAAAEAALAHAARVAAEEENERQRLAAIARQQEEAAAAVRAEEQRKAAAALAEQQAAVAEQQRVFAEQQAAFAQQQHEAFLRNEAERAAIKAEADALATARARADAEKLAADERAALLKHAPAQVLADDMRDVFKLGIEDPQFRSDFIATAQAAGAEPLEINKINFDLAAPGTDITTLTEVDAAGAVVAVEVVARQPLQFAYNGMEDVLTVEDIQYCGEMFRQLGGILPVGVPFTIVARKDGVLTVYRSDEVAA